MLAMTLLTTMNRFQHGVLLPTWYWSGALFDGACYLFAGAQPRR
jgi:hypothetical protein